LREFGAPVSHWMVDAVSPRPGERVLELAAGLGETGMLAAELVAPMGGVIISDQAEAMLEGARARAVALGLSNVEFQVLNAEWIDLPVASVDAVICRWGYMLMADPATALSETRRVLRPGGRTALAVWDAIDHNPWAQLPARELLERGLGSPPQPGTPGPFALGSSQLVAELLERGLGSPPQPGKPGPFALGSSQLVAELLERSGFSDVRVDELELVRRHSSFEELWDSTLDLSRVFHDTVLERPEAEIEEIKTALADRFSPYTAPDGTLEIPGRTLLAYADA
jgi:SAM-dependent methyltransferase